MKTAKILTLSGLAALTIGVLCLIVKALLPETIDAQGILHEHFFLLPAGFFALFAGVILVALGVFLKVRQCGKAGKQ